MSRSGVGSYFEEIFSCECRGMAVGFFLLLRVPVRSGSTAAARADWLALEAGAEEAWLVFAAGAFADSLAFAAGTGAGVGAGVTVLAFGAFSLAVATAALPTVPALELE